MPASYNHYYEPFFGGGAVFLALNPAYATLSDLNTELISCYTQVRDKPEEVIAYLKHLPNTETDYYLIRNKYPLSVTERAARLIYLSVLSFNGIFRQNRFGVFNVPYGQRTNVNPCDEEKIRNVSQALAKTKLVSGDFEDVLGQAKYGDLVYLDPPYTVTHQDNAFIKYNSKMFLWQDQERLARVAHDLKDKGCYLIISNADHESVHELYPGFEIETVSRNSIIAASSSNRRVITECIIHNRTE